MRWTKGRRWWGGRGWVRGAAWICGGGLAWGCLGTLKAVFRKESLSWSASRLNVVFRERWAPLGHCRCRATVVGALVVGDARGYSGLGDEWVWK